MKNEGICAALVFGARFCAGCNANSPRNASPQSDSGQHSMGDMEMGRKEESVSWLPSPHDGSGTSWQPASVPGYMLDVDGSGWQLMAHGTIFADYNQQGGPRGAGKAESINWGMLMEQHKLGSGTLMFRQMFSAESLTVTASRFPGVISNRGDISRRPLVDHQHPHNVFAELAAMYTVPLTDKDFVGALRRSVGGTGAGTGYVSASCVCGGIADGSAEPSSAGFDAYQLWSRDYRIHH